MSSFKPTQRRCVVCRADLSAVKTPAGWRLPQMVHLTVAVYDSKGGRIISDRHFCPGCVSSTAVAIDFDRWLEKGIIK